jgi:hypothetical protein
MGLMTTKHEAQALADMIEAKWDRWLQAKVRARKENGHWDKLHSAHEDLSRALFRESLYVVRLLRALAE